MSKTISASEHSHSSVILALHDVVYFFDKLDDVIFNIEIEVPKRDQGSSIKYGLVPSKKTL